VFSVAVKTQVPILGAWFTDGARTAIAVEAGRALRTLNAAAIRSDVFWISTDNGATWGNTGFTVALDATGTRAVLTSTGAAWPASEPLRTTTTENRHALVTSNLVKLRGTSTACPVDEPAPTISAQGTHLAEVRVDAADRARDAALARVQSATTAISSWPGRRQAPASYWAELTAAHREWRRCESELASAITRRNIAWGQVPSLQWAAVPRSVQP
jgi:hypothetical protein